MDLIPGVYRGSGSAKRLLRPNGWLKADFKISTENHIMILGRDFPFVTLKSRTMWRGLLNLASTLVMRDYNDLDVSQSGFCQLELQLVQQAPLL